MKIDYQEIYKHTGTKKVCKWFGFGIRRPNKY